MSDYSEKYVNKLIARLTEAYEENNKLKATIDGLEVELRIAAEMETELSIATKCIENLGFAYGEATAYLRDWDNG